MEEVKIIKSKRLIIDVPPEFHMEIKAICAKKDITIKSWAQKILLKALKEERVKKDE